MSSPSLHVLLVSSSSGSRGGGELYLVGLTEGLRQLGHRVTAWMSDGPHMDELAEALRHSGAQVVRSAYRNTYQRRTRAFLAWREKAVQRRLTAEFDRLRPDLIHVNKQNLEDGLDLLLAAEACVAPAVATIHITRTMQSLGARWAVARDAVAARVLRSGAAPLIAVAPQCGEDLRAVLGHFGGARVASVDNGVRDAAPAADRAAVRREWGFGPEDFVLGNAARIEEQKNPLFLVELLRQLPARVKLVWIGDGRLRPRMQERIDELGLQRRVVLDGWRTDVPRRLSGLDAFVLPSLYEGLPLVILEAMSASLPVAASPVDGVRRAVEHGATGFVLPLEDPRLWIQAMGQLQDSPELRQRLGAAARRKYEAQFSTLAMASATVAVYQRALAARGAADVH